MRHSVPNLSPVGSSMLMLLERMLLVCLRLLFCFTAADIFPQGQNLSAPCEQFRLMLGSASLMGIL
jgi:hypothetical protein